jgi:hypothetical protein
MMRSSIYRSRNRRRGVVLILTALCLVALVGIVAIVIDGGMLQDRRRHLQAAADAAAMAAAVDIFTNYPRHGGSDVPGSARQSARAVAEANGYSNSGSTTSVTVNVPPNTGIFAGKTGYAEVIITYKQPRFFSMVFGSDDLPITARAVARGEWAGGKIGVMALDMTAQGSLNSHGNGDINVNGAPIIVNSNNAEAAIGNGTNAHLLGPEFSITGGYSTSGGATFEGTMLTGQRPEPDPLRYIPPPDPTSMPLGTDTVEHLPGGAKIHRLTPGVFRRGLMFSGQDTVIMAPGIYYMDEGGFSFSGSGSLTGLEVMIYNKPLQGESQRIDISGLGAVTLTPPTTGPYAGIVFFQDRTSTEPVKITGNGMFDIKGTVYAANAPLMISGNGDFTLGSQHISRTIDLGGNGAFNINWNPNQVGKTRVIQLVE